MKYTHFRFGVGCHDVNGFWYSKYQMTFDNLSILEKQWIAWKKLEKDLKRKEDDDREMLIDQMNKNGDIFDTIVIPSAYADAIQRQIFKDEYEELKFDIWSVKPETVSDMKAKLEKARIQN